MIIYHIRTALTAALPLFFLTATFVGWEKLMAITIAMAFVILLVSLPAATGISKNLGYALLILASTILLFSESELSHWYNGIANNIDLISLFLTVPLLSIPLRYGNYLESVEGLFRKLVRKNYQVYGFSMLGTYLLGAVFNMASLYIINQLFGQNGNRERRELVSLASLRGFTACIFWSPTFFSVGIVLSMTGVSWLDIFPIGLLLSFAVMALSFVMDVIDKKRRNISEVMSNHTNAEYCINYSKLFELIFVGGVLLSVTVTLHAWLEISMLVLVPAISIAFSLCWLIFLNKITMLPQIAKDYYQEEIPKHSNEVVLFTGAGLFGAALAASSLSLYLGPLLQGVLGGEPLITVILISLIIVSLFIIGINPIITITVLMSSAQHFDGYGEPFFLALGMIVGWAIGILISPFAAVNLSAAALINKSPVQVSIRNNYLYAMLMLPLTWLLIALIY